MSSQEGMREDSREAEGSSSISSPCSSSALGFLPVQLKNKGVCLLHHNFMRTRPNGFNVMP